MSPEDAAIAAKWLKPKTVVPIHYNTFPVIHQDPYKFIESLEAKNGKVMQVGEVIEL